MTKNKLIEWNDIWAFSIVLTDLRLKMAKELEEAIEWVVEQFVSRRRYGVCQVSSALLVHRIDSGEVIEGFLIFDDDKEFVRHYWTRVNGMNIDIGMMSHDKLFPNNIRSCYLYIWPPTGKFVYIYFCNGSRNLR